MENNFFTLNKSIINIKKSNGYVIVKDKTDNKTKLFFSDETKIDILKNGLKERYFKEENELTEQEYYDLVMSAYNNSKQKKVEKNDTYIIDSCVKIDLNTYGIYVNEETYTNNKLETINKTIIYPNENIISEIKDTNNFKFTYLFNGEVVNKETIEKQKQNNYIDMKNNKNNKIIKLEEVLECTNIEKGISFINKETGNKILVKTQSDFNNINCIVMQYENGSKICCYNDGSIKYYENDNCEIIKEQFNQLNKHYKNSKYFRDLNIQNNKENNKKFKSNYKNYKFEQLINDSELIQIIKYAKEYMNDMQEIWEMIDGHKNSTSFEKDVLYNNIISKLPYNKFIDIECLKERPKYIQSHSIKTDGDKTTKILNFKTGLIKNLILKGQQQIDYFKCNTSIILSSNFEAKKFTPYECSGRWDKYGEFHPNRIVFQTLYLSGKLM